MPRKATKTLKRKAAKARTKAPKRKAAPKPRPKTAKRRAAGPPKKKPDKRKQAKPPPPPKKGQRVKTPIATRMEAKLHAADQLARAQSMIKVQRDLQGKPWKLHASTARSVVLEVLKEWELQDSEEISKARRRQFHRIYRLYNRAFELEQLNVCARLEKLLADLEGTWPAKTEEEDPAGHGVDDEFENRPAKDLEYYVKMGFWPEEAPTGLPN